jgi:hypothetical protein
MGMAVDAYDVYGAYKSMRTRALAKAFAKQMWTGKQANVKNNGKPAGAGMANGKQDNGTSAAAAAAVAGPTVPGTSLPPAPTLHPSQEAAKLK